MSTQDLPEGERSDWYHELIGRSVAPTRLAIENPNTFHASAGTLALGACDVSCFSHGALRSWRTPALIRRGDPGQYILALITEGSMWISQRRNDAEIAAGEVVVFDTSQPHTTGTGAGTHDTRLITLHLLREAVPLPGDRIDRLVARSLPAHGGMGVFLSRFMRTLATHAADCSPRERRRLGTLAVDLASGFLAHHLGARDRLPARTRAQLLMQRIDAFIAHNLHDPALSPGVVAARHHISLRTLYAVFEQREESVAASIRNRRLERCRADLARPELAARPIHVIATRWGFTNVTVFGRAFRDAYGLTPGAFRHRALHGASHREN
ncbi:helix-turn-helix domain-containing protein [Streptomyces sp. NPDC051018]|uniref:AraC-like ligand-binding domain-containing protein n=1 Tax=Streptomyces sp. NPDC051018 TaxID=3365639 RepID=UPI0037A1739A